MVNYQVCVDLASYCLAISFPIALVFIICQKIIGSVLGVMFGKDISF